MNDDHLSNPDAATVGKYQRPGDASTTQIASALQAWPATGTWRRRVLNEITYSGDRGMTDEELQLTLGLNPSTERPRRVELVEGGWVEDSGRRRPTRSGRAAVVWVLTPAAREPEAGAPVPVEPPQPPQHAQVDLLGMLG